MTCVGLRESTVKRSLDDLAGGDRRSIGKADLVAEQALQQPGLLAMIIDGFGHAEAVVRMRSADVAEKVSRQRPDMLAPHKEQLLQLLHSATEAELRWHLAQIVPRLGLEAGERSATIEVLKGFLQDRSRIVQAFSLQALVDLTVDDPAQRRLVSGVVETLARTGSPAVRARARKLRLKLLALTASKPSRHAAP